MGPSSPRANRYRKLRVLVIGIVIISAIAGLIWVLNPFDSEGGTEPYFMEVYLVDQKISPGENTLLKAKVSNPSDITYRNLKIQLVTASPEIELGYLNQDVLEENDKYFLTISSDNLRGGEETKLYAFDVGGDLHPGLVSMTAEIEARVLAGGEIPDRRDFRLTITSENS